LSSTLTLSYRTAEGNPERSPMPAAIRSANARVESQCSREGLRMPMIVRDPASNARWTVEAELRRCGLTAAPPSAEVATPEAADREAMERSVPVLLSRRVLHGPHWATPPIDGLVIPRSFVLVLPAAAPSNDVKALMGRMRVALI
jgi:hypothetical protein